MRFKDVRGLANLTLKELIIRYREEIGAEHPFGKNKPAVLNMWERDHGDKTLAELTDDYLTDFVRARRKVGAGGVTIGIDLTYLGSIFKTARYLWKLPVRLAPGCAGSTLTKPAGRLSSENVSTLARRKGTTRKS